MPTAGARHRPGRQCFITEIAAGATADVQQVTDMFKVSPPPAQYNGNRRHHSIDFQRIAQAALERAEHFVPVWLRDGRRRGREWVAKNPTRADRHAGSFSVNLATGRWADFATADRGGDLIALRAYLDGTGQADAARKLEAELGQA